MKFDGYELQDYLVKAIKDIGFKELSEVQKLLLDNFDSKKNIIATSKTGSGKTHAFLLPIFNNLDLDSRECQAVIISPTLELARQTLKVSLQLASFCGKTINVKAYYGGTDTKRDIEKIKKNMPQIVIATPGKLVDLVINENVLKIHNAKWFVIDEIDMITESFLEDIYKISDKFKDVQKLVFSATISDSVEQFLKKFIPNALMLDVEKKDVSALKIKHYLIPDKNRDRLELLLELTKIINPYLSIIFANKKEMVKTIYDYLKSNGINVTYINGDLSVRERRRILNEINNLKYQYVVASDMLARGIDINGVSHIINYDLPKDFEFYIHRSGRTGRMNSDGVCYSFYDELNDTYLSMLEKRGIIFESINIKNGELVEYKERNSREKRVKPITEAEKLANRLVKKPKVVKPGYKKKMNAKREEIIKSINMKRGRNR